ncbi:MAG: hypothetical protein L6277_15695 [Desulfobacterales bacterium]|nr:hypothetical protein [Pseudomonadota bacterium]MBU4355796.1 hypothetical protein [Pseudomonadota bacterium]MCG2773517.1 hypothetical protein [Desulfobacterales bacterium]
MASDDKKSGAFFYSPQPQKKLVDRIERQCLVLYMEAADYTLKDVPVIIPNLKPRTVQMWVKRGVIRPSISSSGQGFPVRFSYLNLIEIALVWQIIRLGLDSHAYFLRVMDYAQKLRKVNRWIDGSYNFECIYVIPESSAFGRLLDKEEAKDYVLAPPFILINPEGLNEFFKKSNITGWLLVDVGAIKRYVDGKIAAM